MVLAEHPTRLKEARPIKGPQGDWTRVDVRGDPRTLADHGGPGIFFLMLADDREALRFGSLWDKDWFLPHSPDLEKRVRAAVPLPGAWGKQLEGLRLGLRLRRSQVPANKPVVVEVGLQNVGDKPVTVPQHRYNIYDYFPFTQFTVIGPDERVWPLTKSVGAMREADHPLVRTLLPGEAYIHAVDVRRWQATPMDTKTPSRPKADFYFHPGVYTITSTYSVKRSAVDVWTGILRSNELALTVIPPVTNTPPPVLPSTNGHSGKAIGAPGNPQYTQILTGERL